MGRCQGADFCKFLINTGYLSKEWGNVLKTFLKRVKIFDSHFSFKFGLISALFDLI